MTREKGDEARDEIIRELFRETRRNRLFGYFKLSIWLLFLLSSIAMFYLFWYSDKIAERQAKTLESISSMAGNRNAIIKLQVRILKESVADETTQKKIAHIAVVPLRGAITSASSSDSRNSTISEDSLRDILETLKQDADVKFVIFVVNSPGGGHLASDNVYELIRRFNTKDRHVAVYVEDMAASGGYYISLASDFIYTHPLALVGNIGVRLDRWDISKLAERFGVDVFTYKSGELKDLGNLFRTPTEVEKDVFMNLINKSMDVFVSRVESARSGKIDLSKRDVIFDGRIFSADEAEDLGLIDGTAYFDDFLLAIANTTELKDFTDIVAYEYFKKKDFWEGLRVSFSSFIKETFTENLPVSIELR